MRFSLAITLGIALLPGGGMVMPVWMPAPEAASPALSASAVPARAILNDGPEADAPAPYVAAVTHDFRQLRLAGPFPARVGAVIDGDTFEARVTIWLGHEVTTRVRILGIDAAEMGAECREEREMALISREALRQMLGSTVSLSDVRFDKYGGRVLARAASAGYPDIGGAMLAGGYALAYEGGRRQAWCNPVLTSRK